MFITNTIRFATATGHAGQSGSTQSIDKVFQCVAFFNRENENLMTLPEYASFINHEYMYFKKPVSDY